MQHELRHAPRVSLDVEVNFAARAIAHTKDLSSGGLCLITEEPLKVGKILSLSFTLPGQSDRLNCFGKVQWSRPGGEGNHENGISFWDATPEVQKLVTGYLSQGVM
ncbi:MAG TPA: PilZ domain-containing protein [Spirochaetia bacterium]|nr:PilZ domain-containing protein [Spirochaetia bacterium]